MERTARMTWVDYFSSLGGLFGLCLGFSVISFIEVSISLNIFLSFQVCLCILDRAMTACRLCVRRGVSSSLTSPTYIFIIFYFSSPPFSNFRVAPSVTP